jgi:hypothetical protein
VLLAAFLVQPGPDAAGLAPFIFPEEIIQDVCEALFQTGLTNSGTLARIKLMCKFLSVGEGEGEHLPQHSNAVDLGKPISAQHFVGRGRIATLVA